MTKKTTSPRYWLITVNMGYGHARAAFPLKDQACQRVITANSDRITSPKEQKEWETLLGLYESVSRIEQIPIIGKILFGILSWLEKIPPMHPFTNQSTPTVQVLGGEYILKKGLCQSVYSYIKSQKKGSTLPILTPFFVTALAAQKAGLKRVYCIATDTDISRVWVAKEPHKSQIRYFAPTEHTAKRLQLYGVPPQNINVTGFPLPKELIGGTNQKILKQDLHKRLQVLDMQKNFELLQNDILPRKITTTKKEQLTILYAIGGAGAHKKIAKELIHSLSSLIRQKKIRLIITCGTKLNIAQELQTVAQKLQIDTQTIYFEEFNTLLRQADILWTKPSELSFYCGLGIPIIISPPLGEHEHYNKRWLEQIGAGLPMDNPKYAHEWIVDWWQRGLFAKAAVDGYMLAPKMGTYNIQKIIRKQQ
jgi:hypothetical protein